MKRNSRDQREPMKGKIIVGGKPYDPDESWEGAISRGIKKGATPEGSSKQKENRMGSGGILAGVHDFIDKKLHVSDVGDDSPHYKNIGSCKQVSGTKPPPNFRGVEFIRDIYQKIEANWNGGKGSAKNFRWEPHPSLTMGKTGKGHTGAEVPFERAIVILSELKHGYGLGSWTNEVPVASGLIDGGSPGVRAIDLIHRHSGEVEYDFIELKMPPEKSGETPLQAAIEILLYGLLYVFSRVHMKELENNRTDGLREELKKGGNERLLGTATKRVNLFVVAPDKFYEPSKGKKYELSWLEQELDIGLREFLKTVHPELGLLMRFRFERCDNEFLKEDMVSGHGLILRFEPSPVYNN
jgi:hypothetical protein